MIREMAAAVPDRDERGRESACAKGVDARISRNVGISVSARMPNAYAWCGAGRRRSGRRGGGRTKRSRPSRPRPSGRAVSVPRLRRNHLNLRKLRRRVVTQQKFLRRLSCAIGRGAMRRRRSLAATSRYCCDACRQAVRRVLDRERKWQCRGTFRGRRRREQEYQAARTRRGSNQHHAAGMMQPRPPPP